MRTFKLLLLVLFAATMCPAVYGQQSSVGSIPADKKEIIDRFIAGTLDPSYTPALFFGHFGNGKKLGEGALKAHLSLFLKGGCRHPQGTDRTAYATCARPDHGHATRT